MLSTVNLSIYLVYHVQGSAHAPVPSRGRMAAGSAAIYGDDENVRTREREMGVGWVK